MDVMECAFCRDEFPAGASHDCQQGAAMNCCACDAEIQPSWTFYEEVTGWTKKRSQGGSNAVAMRSPTGRVMCRGCMETAKLPQGQMSFDDIA